MLLSGRLVNWASHRVVHWNQESLIHHLFGRVRIGRRFPLDDRVKGLNSRPLGMFLYNQRAFFFACSAALLMLLTLLVGVWPSNEKTIFTVWVLSAFWLFDVVMTLVLHKSFIDRLNHWVASPAIGEFPPLFDRYFQLDSAVVALLLIVGKLWDLNLDSFAFLLFTNVVVYSTYIQGSDDEDNKGGVAFLVQLLVALGFLVTMRPRIDEPSWFYLFLNTAPLLLMCLIIVLSVLMVSLLRTIEHGVTQRRLELLGRYERVLSERAAKAMAKESGDTDYSERQFREQATKVLKHLCAPESPFWYKAACLWLAEKHQDREVILLPGAHVNFEEAEHFENGLEDQVHFSETTDLLLFHSLKHLGETDAISPLPFRRNVDAPAAFIQLRRDGRRIGVLALYGKENGPPLMREDDPFLRALGSIVGNTMEQWEGRYKTLPHKEMDNLFSCQSLDEVFPQAVSILRKYLEAAGCMVIFRPDPSGPEMEIVATEGFARSMPKDFYQVGAGQTGKCAEIGQPVRWDDVPAHASEFNPKRLRALERAHGKKIKSWMVVPIGDKQNYGVIKVLNSEFRCNWFTDDDQLLAQDLARRLHLMIEKFLHIQEIEKAKERAQHNADEARVAQQRAERFARQRQEDLMIITHQLQGPLSSIIFTVKNMQRKLLHQGIQDERLRYVHALVEDALALSFGTFSTFAREAGKDTFFGASDIDAPEALKSLCLRLQKTNAKDNLKFIYNVEEGFPILRMDSRVFTSVFYSLVHNAMKYADPFSKVVLECSFERSTGKAALKVKSLGEPILPQEKEAIFQKYRRGSVIERTGRYHSGVGLGLWVARELMLAVGGDLTVELSAEQPDLSVFIVHIPMAN